MLFADFTTAFNDADTVFITDIYSAGENELDDINKETLISALTAGGHKDAREFQGLQKLESFVKENLNEGDVIIFLGAGDITQYAKKFSEILKEKEKVMYNIEKNIYKNYIPKVQGVIKKGF